VLVGAHHIEPSMVPGVGYTEVNAVARDARGVVAELPAASGLASATS
jgi:hypothetical protein